MQLDAIPQRIGARTGDSRGAKFTFDALRCFGAAAIVEIDPIANGVMDCEPVARLEVALRGARAVTEQRVVTVETFEQDSRDRERRVVRRGRMDLIGTDGGGHRAAAAYLAALAFSICSFRT